MRAEVRRQGESTPAREFAPLEVASLRPRRLRALRAAVERELEKRGGFHGPVRPEQRVWSSLLDQLHDAEGRAS